MNVPESLVMTGQLLAGRTVIMCGAGRTRDMGLTTSRLFAEHGAKVVMLDVDEAEVVAAATLPGGSAVGLRADVTSLDSCKAAVDKALAWAPSGGRIDAVVNFSGVTQKRKLLEITSEDFDLVNAINFKGALNISQAVIPVMQKQKSGSIVHISSMSAQQGGGVYGGAHYCGAKAGVLGLVRSIAKEFGPENIRANAISPGVTLTDFSRSGRTDEEKHASTRGWPLQRAAITMEMAGACLFLASDLSTYVTGSTLDVNGGAYMR